MTVIKKKKIKKMENGVQDEYIMEVDDFFDDWCGDSKNEVDLSSYRRCKISNVDYHPTETLVTFEDVDSKNQAVVSCKEFW